MLELAPMLLGFDRQGWIIGYGHGVFCWGAALRLNQQKGVSIFLASLATLAIEVHWHLIVDYEIREIEFECRKIAY